MKTRPVAEIPPFINPTRNKVNMNSRQLMNPDLVISNNLARFLNKMGFVRLEEQKNPTFIAARGNNVAWVIFEPTNENKAELYWIIINNTEYYLRDCNLNKVMRGFS
jgi:hypothetical protein